MKKRIILLILCLTLLFSIVCTGEEPNTPSDDTAERAESLLGGIAMSVMGEKDIQAFIDSDLIQVPAFEWYIIALSQKSSYDFSSCYVSLINSFKNTSERAAVTRQKYALALLAASLDEGPVASEIDRTIGAQGIMSWVYGLHLIHNGFSSASHTEPSMIETLLSLQLSDGGWALSGSVGNADVTAMVMQALAPHSEKANVHFALERAVTHLSNLQEPEGGYKSYGVLNPETTSQVIVALTACGIDPFADERFVKNGFTLLDALSLFVLEDGSLSHTLAGASSPMATAQAFYSLVSYERMRMGKSSLYDFDKTSPAPKSSRTLEIPLYKWITAAVIALLTCAAMLLLILLKKRSYKNFLFILMVALGLVAFVFLSDFQSANDFYSDSAIEKKNIAGRVTLEIRCDTIASKTDKKHIPADGTVLTKTQFPLAEGDTVYDILVEACRQNKIHMEKSGAKGMIYITGINYTYEFDFGDLSGWKYYVNGVSPSVGCDQFVLKDGDHVKWLYSLELGNDIG